jgi:immune inhibitor A
MGSGGVTGVVVVLVLVILCLLVLCCAAAGLLLWQTLDSSEPGFVQLPVPAPTLPASGPPSAVALETEARLNAAIVPVHDPILFRTLLASKPDDVSAPTPPLVRVGDRRRFELDGPVEAELIHVTDHIYVWLVVGVEADRQALIAAGERFEREIYPVVRRTFGTEWSPGVDGDPHLSILHYEDRDDDAAGYFSPSDELPQWVDRTSNATEMFYINLDGMEPGEEFYFAVLAHEFEHMIHWYNDRNETDWLDEGLAELACRVAGFDPGNNDETFLAQPDLQLNHWPDDDDTTPHYGAGYLLALYLWEHFGDGLIWDLAHHPADGMAALDAVLDAQGTGVTADEVFADWVVVNVLNEGQYGYEHEEWKVDVGIDATHDRYPASRQTTVYPYGTDYVELSGAGDLLIEFDGLSQTALLPVSPHSGETAWWSNRGNRSDAHLVRRFDLSGLSQATLRFWTWYDLERRYDYVYVLASADGGQTWEVLRGEGASGRGDYGSAYNGESDGWVEEEVDLSPYAGREVWVRFDYVTDDSINGVGFLLDDLSIPELGLVDPCDEVGDWQAEGFVLVGPQLPQRWVVQAIEVPAGFGPVRIHRMSLDEQQTGELELTLDGGVERMLLAISALARGTTEPAAYHYRISLR